MRALLPVLGVALGFFLLVTGCRTYGDSGYESGPKMYRQMQEAPGQGEEDRAGAQADRRRWRAAADTGAGLDPRVGGSRGALTRHEEVLDKHRTYVESLSASSSYRSLHRAYGAMTTDERVLRTIYNRTIRRVYAAVHGTEVDEGDGPAESTYFTEPVEYRRAANQQDQLTMQEALRR